MRTLGQNKLYAERGEGCNAGVSGVLSHYVNASWQSIEVA